MTDEPQDNDQPSSEPEAEAAHEAAASPGETTKTTETEPAPRPPAPAAAASARPPAKAEKPENPAVVAARGRKRPPFWAMAVLVALPVWAIIYVNAVTKPSKSASDPLVLGGQIYASTCAGCHGANGEGGVGPKLAGGDVLKAWPNYQDHIQWVTLGAAGWTQKFPNRPTSGNGVKLIGGSMPAQGASAGGSLTPDQITLVVYYERQAFGGKAEPALLQAATTAAQGAGGGSSGGASTGGASSSGGGG